MRKRWIVLVVVLLLPAAVYFWWNKIVLGSASVASDVTVEEWSVDHMEDIAVALDVGVNGEVYVAETGQFNGGAGDNRQQAFWLPQDMVSTSIDDRLAYVKAAVADGNLTEEWFDAKDTLRVIRDTDGDGRADEAKVVAEMSGYLDGVMAGVLATDDGLLVTNIPRVYRLRDTDGDDKADDIKVLSEGYGLRTAFVGHDLHGLVYGPDGRIYFSVGDRGFNVKTAEGAVLKAPLDEGRGGVFRMQPDGSELELFAWGLRNPQELAFDDYGNLITGDNNSDGGDKARIVYLVEGGDSGWTYGYQYMEDDDYLRGPWNAERLWEPYHETQPAWIVPPLANETNGPSGLAHYPGLGLSERYKGHFFLSNYSFVAARSWILSFELKEQGAGFTVEDVHQFASNDLFIDQGFGYDGKMYAVTSAIFGGPKKILRMFDPEAQTDPRIAEARELLQAGLQQQSTERLLELLAHADQRLRLKTQYELANRKASEVLNALAFDSEAEELARIHALWALGQIGSAAFDAWSVGLDKSVFSGELLAQALRAVAEAKALSLKEWARAQITNENARVSYFAAMAAGHLQDPQALPAITSLLESNANSDPFIRHAAVWALTKITDAESLQALAGNQSSAVRLGALLAARRLQTPLLAGFLNDSDPSLVTEAARAIHDLRLADTLPSLAALANTDLPLLDDDAQTSYALHRRVINANLLLGGEQQAVALGNYAANEKNPLAMRTLALDTLGEFTQPPVADKVWGDHLALEPRAKEIVNTALDASMPALMESSLREQAMQVAVGYGRVTLQPEELAMLVADNSQSSSQRVNALKGLSQSDDAVRAAAGMETALASDNSELRSAALVLLAKSSPQAAVDKAIAVAEATDSIVSLEERQSAFALLGGIDSSDATAYLQRKLAEFRPGDLSADIQLDVLQAARKSANSGLQAKVKAVDQQRNSAGPVAARRIAMSGGDAEQGKRVFENLGDCLRCHSVEQRGGVAGPALDGVATLYDQEYLYRSMMEPAADIAPGFGNVALLLQDGRTMAGIMLSETADLIRLQHDSGHGDVSTLEIPVAEITDKQGPFSGMPPLGLTLSEPDLRDVMAYLQTLK